MHTQRLRPSRNLRSRVAWAMIRARAVSDEKKINERKVSGLKVFKNLKPLFERLPEVGCERDRAGNRRRHDDPYCCLVLVYVFNPVVSSLRAKVGGAAGQRCYVMDRGYAQFQLFNEIHINKSESSYICRLRDKSSYDVVEDRALSREAKDAEIISDQIVQMGARGLVYRNSGLSRQGWTCVLFITPRVGWH